MNLSDSDQALYPKFAHYVRYDFPKLKKVNKIMTNLKKYGHITPAEFQIAMVWGAFPIIKIRDLHNWQCGVAKAYGCFRSSKAHHIEIHIGVVTDFENATATSTDLNTAGQAVYVAGATILHELCHWGNYNNVPRIPEIREMGGEFEKATYGQELY